MEHITKYIFPGFIFDMTVDSNNLNWKLSTSDEIGIQISRITAL